MGETYSWGGGNGFYADPTQWVPLGVPLSGDTAVVTAGTIDMTGLSIDGTTIDVTGSNEVRLLLGDTTFYAATTLGYAGLDGGLFGPELDVSLSGVVRSSGLIMDEAGYLGIDGSGSFINTGTIVDDHILEVGFYSSGSVSFENAGLVLVNGTGSGAELLSGAAILDSGTIDVSAAYLGLDNDLGGEGTIILDSADGNAMLEASGLIAAAQSIELEGSSDIFDLHGATPYDAYVDGSMAASITGFGGSDFVEIVSSGPLDGVHFADDELTLSHDGTVVYSLHVVGDYASDASSS